MKPERSLDTTIKQRSQCATIFLQDQAAANLERLDAEHGKRATKAGLDPSGLGPKTLRKSWESWLVASSPERVLDVFLSQGDTQMTALSHFLGPPFTMADKKGMKEWVGGWEK